MRSNSMNYTRIFPSKAFLLAYFTVGAVFETWNIVFFFLLLIWAATDLMQKPLVQPDLFLSATWD